LEPAAPVVEKARGQQQQLASDLQRMFSKCYDITRKSFGTYNFGEYKELTFVCQVRSEILELSI
jgi:hypothetical protein